MDKEDYKKLYEQYNVRPDVLNYDDVAKFIPKLKGHKKFVDWLLHFLSVDRVNYVHGACCDTPGPEFVKRLLFEQFKVKLRIDGREVLDNLPQGAFITISNHPFGALDGIMLIYLITRYRPEYRVMVNMVLNNISAMRPNFIAVDPSASTDPEKRKVSVAGIRHTLEMLRDDKPVGFFPAGAMSKINLKGQLNDLPWQPSVLSIIKKAKVPVIPIFFHGGNSFWFNFLGIVCWQARTLALPAEVFKKVGKEMHISVGDLITAEKQNEFATADELGAYLRAQTFALRERK